MDRRRFLLAAGATAIAGAVAPSSLLRPTYPTMAFLETPLEALDPAMTRYLIASDWVGGTSIVMTIDMLGRWRTDITDLKESGKNEDG